MNAIQTNEYGQTAILLPEPSGTMELYSADIRYVSASKDLGMDLPAEYPEFTTKIDNIYYVVGR